MLGVAAQRLLCLTDHGVCVVSCAHLQVELKVQFYQDTLSICKPT